MQFHLTLTIINTSGRVRYYGMIAIEITTDIEGTSIDTFIHVTLQKS